jgi:hypothetical protein
MIIQKEQSYWSRSERKDNIKKKKLKLNNKSKTRDLRGSVYDLCLHAG